MTTDDWPEGLAEELTAHGYDVTTLDRATAVAIAESTFWADPDPEPRRCFHCGEIH